MAIIDKVNLLGGNFVNLAQVIGYWVILVGALIAILKCAFNRDKNGVVATFYTAMIMFSTLYIMPYAMQLVKDVFRQ